MGDYNFVYATIRILVIFGIILTPEVKIKNVIDY